MLPRPHTLETEHTFVNGIRNIEGIQEFFLVVARPASVSGFCVEAYLETGHIGKVPYTTTEEVAGTEMQTTWSDSYHAAPRGDGDETTVYDAADRSWAVDTFYPGLGYQIKSALLTSPGPAIRYNKDPPNLVDAAPHISASNPDYVTVSGKVHSGFANYAVDEDRWEEITYPFTVAITLVKHEVVQRSTDTLFMTGRYLDCCERRVRVDEPVASHGIVYEGPPAHGDPGTRCHHARAGQQPAQLPRGGHPAQHQRRRSSLRAARAAGHHRLRGTVAAGLGSHVG